jgi:hypothetical protein
MPVSTHTDPFSTAHLAGVPAQDLATQILKWFEDKFGRMPKVGCDRQTFTQTWKKGLEDVILVFHYDGGDFHSIMEDAPTIRDDLLALAERVGGVSFERINNTSGYFRTLT